jgi:hypothetical protein
VTTYPPEPWHLRGQMYVSLFLLPRRRLPALPPPLRPVTVAGHAFVGAAWVRYEPGGTLTYRELLSAVLTHERGRPGVTITDIWVDDARSRDGGRALWGIPKELADLRLDPGPGAVHAQAPMAGAEIRPRRWSGRWPLALSVAQLLDAEVRRTPVRGHAALAPARVTWRPDAAGPLGYLAGRRPLLSVAVRDFRLRFGTDSKVTR